MFKGTKGMRAETLDRLTEDVGGYNNAYTTEDYTNYYEVVPSNYLETILWAEADRLSGLIVDEANFATEREVVIGEYDQRILAEPYGMLCELAQREAYTVHPYRLGVIGRSGESARRDARDVRAASTRPTTAPTTPPSSSSGTSNRRSSTEWIDRYFAPIPRPEPEVPRVMAVEPAQSARTALEYRSRALRFPALQMSWHIGAARDVEIAVLDVIETMLGSGGARGSTARSSTPTRSRRTRGPARIGPSSPGCSRSGRSRAKAKPARRSSR